MSNLQSFLQKQQTVTDCLMAVLSGVSGYFTYLGSKMAMDPTSANDNFNLSALIFALGASAAIFLFWRYSFSIVPDMKTRRSRVQGIAIMLFGSVFIVSLSSWSNVIALAGNMAQTSHMNQSYQQQEQALHTAHERSKLALQLVPDITLAASRYRQLAQDEVRRGALTGSPGNGGVANSLQSAANALDHLAKLVQQHGKQADKVLGRGAALLESLNTAMNDDAGLAQRLKMFRQFSGQLAQTTAELSNTNLSKMVSRTSDSLGNTVALYGASDKRGLAKAQMSAVMRIKADMEQTGRMISTAANALTAGESQNNTGFAIMSPAMVVLLYAKDLIPYWVGGIALDLLPLALILLLMAYGAQSNAEPDFGQAVGNMPFKHVAQVAAALEQITGQVKPALPTPTPPQSITPQVSAPMTTTPPKGETAPNTTDWSDEDQDEWDQPHISQVRR